MGVTDGTAGAMDTCVEDIPGIDEYSELSGEGGFSAVEAVVVHGERLRRIAAGLGVCGADIDDVMQEVSVAAVNCGERFGSEGHAIAWAGRVTINRCMLEHRKSRRFRRAAKGIAARLRRRAAGGNDPGAAAIRREEIAAVKRALGGLDEALLGPVALRYFGGLDSGEIAEVLELNASTVRSRLRKGRMVLAKDLMKMGIEP